ncbi:MAG TPA: hypothetical protein VJZ00_00615 [Thermoanaerobaculia bacterium]|nr:hypothetical protein [Thermoanaerobaculia bacterium]
MTPQKQRVLIFAAAGISALAGIGFVGFVVTKTIRSIAHPSEPTADERKLLITIESLAVHDVTRSPTATEHLQSTHEFDGTRRIEYTYRGDRSLYIFSQVQVVPTSLSGMQLVKMQELAMRAGFNAKLRVVPRPELLTFGDQRYAAMLERDDEAIGNLFIVRDGRVVHTLVITGFYFDHPENVAELFKVPMREAKKQVY